MRCLLLKAATLLWANVVSALVIPDTGALIGRPADPIIQYDPSNARLKFVINSVQPVWGYPTLTLDVGPSRRLCAETNIKLDGQQLTSRWSGIQGTGDGILAAYGNAPMSWTITCLWDSSDSPIEDITHLLTLSLSDDHGRQNVPSFTVSFRQFGEPSIIRFEPRSISPTNSNGDFEEWRTPSVPFTSSAIEQANSSLEAPFQPAPTEQKSLLTTIQEIKYKIKEKVDKVIESCKSISLCSKPGKVSYQSDQTSGYAPTSTHEEGAVEHDELDGAFDDYDVLVPSRVEQAGAAQTRDLNFEETSTGTSSSFLSGDQSGIPSPVVLKSFFLSLTILSLVTWIILRWRDPRRRADRAARREERRTKRLYRRAARHQAIRNWVWQARLRYGLVSANVVHEEEKRRRVMEQDAVLEKMMEDDIRALRGTHNAVTAMTGATFAAEEGRSRFSLARGEGSGHRRPRSIRSVSTLPGYESEGTQPPGYDEHGRRASLTEFTSDSSVISTSPRISRDGTNSEYDEKLQELDLNESRVDGTRL